MPRARCGTSWGAAIGGRLRLATVRLRAGELDRGDVGKSRGRQTALEWAKPGPDRAVIAKGQSNSQSNPQAKGQSKSTAHAGRVSAQSSRELWCNGT